MTNSLPIDAALPEIVAALQQSNSLVLRAPAGAGKTTRVPPAILETLTKPHGQIVMVEPRRIAARTAARRMVNAANIRAACVSLPVRCDLRCWCPESSSHPSVNPEAVHVTCRPVRNSITHQGTQS